MRTSTEPRRPGLSARRWRPSLGLLVAAAVGALLPTAAFATHVDFDDGPFAPHDDGVHYMGETGITAGCGDGSNYCPTDPVTRAQMATFLHRMSGNGSIPPNVNAATLDGSTAADLDDAETLNGSTAADLDDAETLDGLTATQLNPVAVASSGAVTQQTVAGLADLPGATVDVTIPEGRTGLILARFNAETSCSGGTGWCQATIFVNGTEADPVVGANFAFDSSDNNTESISSWESHAMERSAGPLPAGTYTVTVQTDIITVTNFWLDDWQLVAEVKLVS